MISNAGGISDAGVVPELTTLGVPNITYGSNANGRWFKTFDQDGNIIRVEQCDPVRTLRANGDTITFPIAFPDTNWHVNISTQTIDRSLFNVLIDASSFTFGSRVASTSAVGSSNITWHAVWIKT